MGERIHYISLFLRKIGYDEVSGALNLAVFASLSGETSNQSTSYVYDQHICTNTPFIYINKQLSSVFPVMPLNKHDQSILTKARMASEC